MELEGSSGKRCRGARSCHCQPRCRVTTLGFSSDCRVPGGRRRGQVVRPAAVRPVPADKSALHVSATRVMTADRPVEARVPAAAGGAPRRPLPGRARPTRGKGGCECVSDSSPLDHGRNCCSTSHRTSGSATPIKASGLRRARPGDSAGAHRGYQARPRSRTASAGRSRPPRTSGIAGGRRCLPDGGTDPPPKVRT
jgi:hypothetical protein